MLLRLTMPENWNLPGLLRDWREDTMIFLRHDVPKILVVVIVSLALTLIAIVRGRLVPVGEDQVAHLELSREIVRRFNRLYGDVLLEPQPLLSSSPLIPGSDGRKMSKSFDNAIGIRDEPDEIRAKVRTFVTDPQKVRMGDPGRPEICPVFALHKTYSPDIVDWTGPTRQATIWR
jgi:tryptophanyl-tRNA synthetase